MELPVTGTYYGDDGNVQNGVSVTYTAKTEGITLNGNEILVPLSYEGTEVTVAAAYNGIEKEIIIPVVEVVYHYTIYYYDFDATHMSENASDLWIWQKSGAGATAGTLFTAKEKLSDGNEWLRADVTLPYTDVQIIPRSKDEWKWQEIRFYTITAQQPKTSHSILYPTAIRRTQHFRNWLSQNPAAS